MYPLLSRRRGTYLAGRYINHRDRLGIAWAALTFSLGNSCASSRLAYSVPKVSSSHTHTLLAISSKPEAGIATIMGLSRIISPRKAKSRLSHDVVHPSITGVNLESIWMT